LHGLNLKILFVVYYIKGERHYETSWFNESVERVLIDDHNVPRL